MFKCCVNTCKLYVASSKDGALILTDPIHLTPSTQAALRSLSVQCRPYRSTHRGGEAPNHETFVAGRGCT